MFIYNTLRKRNASSKRSLMVCGGGTTWATEMTISRGWNVLKKIQSRMCNVNDKDDQTGEWSRLGIESTQTAVVWPGGEKEREWHDEVS